MSTIKEFYYFLIWSYKTSGVLSPSLSFFVFLPTFLTTQVTGFCPGRVSCLPLLLSINLWQLQQQHVDIMNLLLFKYFIFVMALAGDDSSQYTPHPLCSYSAFVFCFFFLLLVICFLVGVRNYLWVCLGKFRPQLDAGTFQLQVEAPELRVCSLSRSWIIDAVSSKYL